MRKVVVIGIDGATWDLIKPWAESGELPTFKKLMDEGVWGDLESTIPPVTGPAWVSFSTGKNPGKHGIFDFVYLKNGNLKLHTSRDIKSLTFYDILSREGFENDIIGLPLSFPPMDGFREVMVSDFLYFQKDVIPDSKKEYLKNYKVCSDFSKKGDDLLEDIIETARLRVDSAKELFVNESGDFYFVLFKETDDVSHTFWKEIKKNTKLGKKAKEIFYIADEFLSWILEQMDENSVLIVMSDHGFGDYPYRININKLLAGMGYLTFETKERESDESISQRAMNHHNCIKHVKLPKVVYSVSKNSLVKPIARRVFKLLFKNKTPGLVKGIDFSNSSAFVPTTESFGIYISKKFTEKEKIKFNLFESLKSLEYNGCRVINRVFMNNQIYSGPYLRRGPDIIFLTNNFVVGVKDSNTLFDIHEQGSYHELTGIFLAYGKCIRKGKKLDAKIYDIAPTILHIFGLPIPEDMDGKVLTEIFEENSEFARRKPDYTPQSYYEMRREDEKLKQRIKNLKFKDKI